MPSNADLGRFIDGLKPAVQTPRADGAVDFTVDGVQGMAYVKDAGETVRASFFIAIDPPLLEAEAWVDSMPPPPCGHLELLEAPTGAVIRFLVEVPAEDAGPLAAKLVPIVVMVHRVWKQRGEPQDVLASLGAAGIAPPPMPGFAGRIRSFAPWHWGTQWFAPFEHYMFDIEAVIRLLQDEGDCFALSHAGHGLNSYGLNLAIGTGPVAAFVQHGFAGVYMEPVGVKIRIAATYARLHALFDGLANVAGPARWLLVYSEFRGECGLVSLEDLASGLTFDESYTRASSEAELFATVASKFPDLEFGTDVAVDWYAEAGLWADPSVEESNEDDGHDLWSDQVHFATPIEQRDGLAVDDVVTALFRAQEFERGPGDQREYWQARLEAMMTIFQLSPSYELRRETALWRMVQTVVTGLRQSCSPFAGILEAPHEVTTVISAPAVAFDVLEKERQRLGHEVVRELLVAIAPTLRTSVVEKERLRELGVPLTPPYYDPYDI